MNKLTKIGPMLAGLSLTLSSLALAQEGVINVVSREEGSGTRSAFVEIVEVVDENGDDLTAPAAIVQNSTNGVMQTVAGDVNAIGYISLGSLDDSVKALQIDGVAATAETVKDGTYPIARPFNIAWNKDNELDELSKDFVDFIHSKEGQAIVEEEGYVSKEEDPQAYEAKEIEGSIEIVGSTSVSPVMEILAEKYAELNPQATINITSNGSSAGMQAALDGTANIGMASRELSAEEADQLEQTVIALDGIAVIVHKDSQLDDLALEKVKEVFLGTLEEWSALLN